MAFTRSPHRLTRTFSIRVEEDFPEALAAASLKAGVPNGVLLGRLVHQFLGDEKPLTAQEHYEALGQSLGYANAEGLLPLRKQDRKPKPTIPAGETATIATIPVPAQSFTWEPQVHTTPIMEPGDFWARNVDPIGPDWPDGL